MIAQTMGYAKLKLERAPACTNGLDQPAAQQVPQQLKSGNQRIYKAPTTSLHQRELAKLMKSVLLTTNAQNMLTA